MPPENEKLLWNLKRAGLIAGGILLLIVLAGGITRYVQASNIKSWTGEADIPTVALIAPAVAGKGQALILPGTLQAYYDAPIYARVPGYVQSWKYDIGAHVKKGDVLAVIDTPELDQQILQAKADFAAAQSNQKLSAITDQRWNSLLPLDAVSKQDVEDKDADLAAKAGAAKAAQARLDQLQAMKGFAAITAPFDGVVTKRTADIGALVNAGPASSGDPLFAVSDVHALRVYVNVPQSYSAEIVPGMQVTLSVPEYPGRSFPAKLVSTSGAISAQSSTLLVEFQADNAAGLLKPGDYTEVHMILPRPLARLSLPASALMFRATGLEVATVGPDNRIVMKPISIDTDLGTTVTVATGLDAGDRVVNNPPDSLGNGDVVRVEGHAE
jgi:RND family efflux transporter MFP subunit